jgi:hypothetical protein
VELIQEFPTHIELSTTVLCDSSSNHAAALDPNDEYRANSPFTVSAINAFFPIYVIKQAQGE